MISVTNQPLATLVISPPKGGPVVRVRLDIAKQGPPGLPGVNDPFVDVDALVAATLFN